MLMSCCDFAFLIGSRMRQRAHAIDPLLILSCMLFVTPCSAPQFVHSRILSATPDLSVSMCPRFATSDESLTVSESVCTCSSAETAHIVRERSTKLRSKGAPALRGAALRETVVDGLHTFLSAAREKEEDGGFPLSCSTFFP